MERCRNGEMERLRNGEMEREIKILRDGSMER